MLERLWLEKTQTTRKENAESVQQILPTTHAGGSCLREKFAVEHDLVGLTSPPRRLLREIEAHPHFECVDARFDETLFFWFLRAQRKRRWRRVSSSAVVRAINRQVSFRKFARSATGHVNGSSHVDVVSVLSETVSFAGEAHIAPAASCWRVRSRGSCKA